MDRFNKLPMRNKIHVLPQRLNFNLKRKQFIETNGKKTELAQANVLHFAIFLTTYYILKSLKKVSLYSKTSELTDTYNYGNIVIQVLEATLNYTQLNFFELCSSFRPFPVV